MAMMDWGRSRRVASRRSAAALGGLVALAACLLAAAAVGAPYVPAGGRVWSGVIGGYGASDISAFASAEGRRPPVVQYFASWGPQTDAKFLDGLSGLAEAVGARAAFALSMSDASGREAITPRALALGSGDRALVGWNQVLADAHGPVYLRPFAEMNQAANPYCAYNSDGSARGPDHSTRWFRQAWRRTALILRGGPVATINRRLRTLRLPPLHATTRALPTPQLALMWVPQVSGNPAIPANSARSYWPGAGYVDWVGTDFYSGFPNFSGLDSYFADINREHKPFVFGEWGIYQSGDDPGFVSALFAWVHTHPAVRMLFYNQGATPASSFRLQHNPATAHQLRLELRDRHIR